MVVERCDGKSECNVRLVNRAWISEYLDWIFVYLGVVIDKNSRCRKEIEIVWLKAEKLEA